MREPIKEDDPYYCDRCEDPIKGAEESYEVRYGFICLKCAESY